MHVSANQNILKSIATNNYSGDDDKDDGNDRDDHGEDDKPANTTDSQPKSISPHGTTKLFTQRYKVTVHTITIF